MAAAAQTEVFSLYDLMHFGPLEIKTGLITDEQFLQFALQYEDLRIEQDKNGLIHIMPPVGYDSGIREGHPYGALYAWWLSSRTGRVCSPSTMFILPDGSKKMADGAWISEEKHQSLSTAERKKIASVVPDFVIEVRSETDNEKAIFEKMTDTWMANGVKLAWLIDPIRSTAYTFLEDGSVTQAMNLSEVLSAEPVCPGFRFDLRIME